MEERKNKIKIQKEIVSNNKNRCLIKAMWIIIDVVKDSLVPHLAKKKAIKEMFDTLVSLYQSEKIIRKMILQNKLKIHRND